MQRFAQCNHVVSIILGEHIDYCGYAVLPMAIEQDIIIATTANDTDRLQLVNTNESFR